MSANTDRAWTLVQATLRAAEEVGVPGLRPQTLWAIVKDVAGLHGSEYEKTNDWLVREGRLVAVEGHYADRDLSARRYGLAPAELPS